MTLRSHVFSLFHLIDAIILNPHASHDQSYVKINKAKNKTHWNSIKSSYTGNLQIGCGLVFLTSSDFLLRLDICGLYGCW